MISVVITYYNDGLYLDDCIESILEQTLQVQQIIIVDDGSNEEMSLKKLKEHENHSKIKIVTQKNQGVSVARNTGLEAVETPYILFLDADDFLDVSFIHKTYQYLSTNPKVGAVSSWVKGFGAQEFEWKLTGGILSDFVLGNNCVVSALMKTELCLDLGGFDEKMKNGYEDWDFWIRVTKKGYKVKTLPECLFNYRQKKNSINQLAIQKHEELHWFLIQKHQDIFYKYWLELMAQKQSTIKNLQSENQKLTDFSQDIYQTASYRIGHLILSPFKFLRKLFS